MKGRLVTGVWKHLFSCLLVVLVSVSVGCDDSETKPNVTVGDNDANNDQNNTNNVDPNNDQNNVEPGNNGQNNDQNNIEPGNNGQNNDQNNTEKPCTANAECGDGFYCKTETCEGSGICEPNTGDCPANFDPVCGCDEETYGNACEAAVAGVSVFYEGHCEMPDDSCSSAEDCGPGSVCVFSQGACGGEAGTCEVFEECPDDSLSGSVCSCDGETYDICSAIQNSVRVAHDGACEPPEPITCSSSAECTEGSVCRFPLGACGEEEGTCEPLDGCSDPSYIPVCGCDGETYDACFAGDSGIRVAHEGECQPEPVTCVEDRDCEETFFCELPSETCNGEGTCEARPGVCDQGLNPVCGCDNRTYGNNCLRLQAGVSLLHEGACENSGECSTGDDCAEGQFCECNGVSCGAGECAPTPTACGRVLDPVCGCDGMTYSNDCERQRAGTCLLHEGSCNQVEPCDSNEECGRARFCEFESGSCENQNKVGVCEIRPLSCDDEDAPVCGCDGVTYSNDCFRRLRAVPLNHEGACEDVEPGECNSNRDCDRDQYCECADDSCGGGSCANRPENCLDVYEPVCGCNNQTYSNDCQRARAGVCAQYSGVCEDTGDTCANNGECDRNEYCSFPEGTCLDPNRGGTCEVRPPGCPDVYEPVCGCNGETYGNACEAAAAGVSVSHEGMCRETPRLCGGFIGGTCNEDEFCDPVPDTCGSPSPAGSCVDISPMCPLVSLPVCGCNGETYDNDCLRIQAEVGKRHDGACLTPGDECTSNDQCPERSFCETDEDTCGEPTGGQCFPLPGICNDVLDPVCGCDLNVYQNDCQRQRAGVQLLHRGNCRL